MTNRQLRADLRHPGNDFGICVLMGFLKNQCAARVQVLFALLVCLVSVMVSSIIDIDDALPLPPSIFPAAGIDVRIW